MLRPIIVFDFETDSPDPITTNPVEIAAVVIDPYKLELIDGAEFSSGMCPPVVDWDKYLENDEKRRCIEWHAKNHKCSFDEIVKTWKAYPDQKHVWSEFSEFVNRFNPKKTKFMAPTCGGINVRGFDIPIADRLNEKYGIKTMFWPRDVEDLLDYCNIWFKFHSNPPKNYKFDTLREYFGMSAAGAHEALVDVRQESELLLKFLRLHKHFANKIPFDKHLK